MIKSLKMMADYGGMVLWHTGGKDVGPIDPDELPISNDLKRELYSWAEKYDQTLCKNYPPDSGFKSIEEENAFEEEGLRLFNALKTELPETTKVIYYSEKQQKTFE